MYKGGEKGIISPSKIPVNDGDHAPSLLTVHDYIATPFPFREESPDEQSDKHKALIELAGLAGIEKFMLPFAGALLRMSALRVWVVFLLFCPRRLLRTAIILIILAYPRLILFLGHVCWWFSQSTLSRAFSRERHSRGCRPRAWRTRLYSPGLARASPLGSVLSFGLW